jgi:TPR repeat protein
MVEKCLQEGHGVEPNPKEALIRFTQAAEKSFSTAQMALGDCYRLGTGIGQDYEHAAKWYRRAAEQMDPIGEYNHGHCLAKGLGVQNRELAANSIGRRPNTGTLSVLSTTLTAFGLDLKYPRIW